MLAEGFSYNVGAFLFELEGVALQLLIERRWQVDRALVTLDLLLGATGSFPRRCGHLGFSGGVWQTFGSLDVWTFGLLEVR